MGPFPPDQFAEGAARSESAGAACPAPSRVLFNSYEFLFGFLPAGPGGVLPARPPRPAVRERGVAHAGIAVLLRVLESEVPAAAARLDRRQFLFGTAISRLRHEPYPRVEAGADVRGRRQSRDARLFQVRQFLRRVAAAVRRHRHSARRASCCRSASRSSRSPRSPFSSTRTRARPRSRASFPTRCSSPTSRT